MRLRLRLGKRGTLEIGMLETVIIALAAVGIVLVLNGQIGQAASEKDYGDSVCRDALANKNLLFNSSTSQALKKATAEISGIAKGYVTAKIGMIVTREVATAFMPITKGGILIKGGKLSRLAVKAMTKADDARAGLKVVKTEIGVYAKLKSVTATVINYPKTFTGFEKVEVVSKTRAVQYFDEAVQVHAGDTVSFFKTPQGKGLVQIISKNAEGKPVITIVEEGVGVGKADAAIALDAAQNAKAIKNLIFLDKSRKFLQKSSTAIGYAAGVAEGWAAFVGVQEAIAKAEDVAVQELESSCGLYIRETQEASAEETADQLAELTAYACDMGQFEEKTTATLARLAGGVLIKDTKSMTLKMVQDRYHGAEDDYYKDNPEAKKYMDSCIIIWRVGGTPLNCNDIGKISIDKSYESTLSTGQQIEPNANMPLKISYCKRKKFAGILGTQHFVEIEDYKE